jgi:hypothetical protein
MLYRDCLPGALELLQLLLNRIVSAVPKPIGRPAATTIAMMQNITTTCKMRMAVPPSLW